MSARRWKNPKPSAAARNSRNGRRISLEDGFFKKWCVKCGAPFTSATEGRRLCELCHWKKVELGGYDALTMSRRG